MARTTRRTRSTTGALAGPVLAGLLAGLIAGLLAVPAQARDRAVRPAQGFGEDIRQGLGLGPSVGRNAGEAIGAGLAGQGAGWIDTMANFYADPHVENRGYFDDYRRPYGRTRRPDRR